MMKKRHTGRKAAAAVASTVMMVSLCAPVLTQLAPVATVYAADGDWTGSDGRPNDSVTPVALQTQIDALRAFMTNANNSFTPASLRAMQKAISDAQVIHDNSDSSTQALTDAYDQLVTAHNNAVSTWNLNAKLKLADDIKGNVVQFAKYNPASTLAFNTAYDAAKSVSMADGPSADTINKAVNNLQSAINGLTLSANKDQLNDALQKALTKDTSTATDDSKKALADAIQHARAIIADPNATQDSANQATADLTNAMNGITQLKIDKTLLEKTIQQASTVDTDKYTAATVLIFKNALTNAQTVDGNQHALQADVDLANKTLLNAISGLVLKIDKTDLLANINIASDIDTSKLTQTQGSNLSDALKNAKKVAGDDNVSQTDVDNANKALKEAIKATQPSSIDKSKLIQTINDGDKYQFGDYTKTSFDQLTAALANGKTVRDDPQSTQTQIDKAVERISSAILGLVKLNNTDGSVTANKQTLNDNLTKAKAIKTDGYTDASKKALADAITKAEKVYADNGAVNSDIVAANTALVTAMNGLTKSDNTAGNNSNTNNNSNSNTNNSNTGTTIDSNGSKGTTIPINSVSSLADNKKVLNDNITKAKAIKTEGYTEASKNALTYAIAKAEKVYADTTAVNSEVIATNNELVTAMDSLVKAQATPSTGSSNTGNNNTGSGSNTNDANGTTTATNTGSDTDNNGEDTNDGDKDSGIDPSDTAKKIGHEPNMKSVRTGVKAHRNANSILTVIGTLMVGLLAYFGIAYKKHHDTHSTTK